MDDTAAAPDLTTGERLSSFKRWTIIGLLTAGGLLTAWLIGSAVLPRWWAQRMSNLIDGRLTAGSLFGLCVGAVFTVLPLTVLAVGWRFRKSWKRALVTVALAVLLAGPNLATLGIVVGNGNAAHAGERILDVDGPGFRGGSLLGAIIGAALFLGVLALASSRGRNKRRAASLRSELGKAHSER